MKKYSNCNQPLECKGMTVSLWELAYAAIPVTFITNIQVFFSNVTECVWQQNKFNMDTHVYMDQWNVSHPLKMYPHIGDLLLEHESHKARCVSWRIYRFISIHKSKNSYENKTLVKSNLVPNCQFCQECKGKSINFHTNPV